MQASPAPLRSPGPRATRKGARTQPLRGRYGSVSAHSGDARFCNRREQVKAGDAQPDAQ
jgi:hypothetical protein